MTPRLVRAGTYGAVALLVLGTLRFIPPLPSRKPAEVLQQGSAGVAAAAAMQQRFDTLASGESLRSLFRRAGVSDSEATRALRAATGIDPRRIPAGMPVTLRATSPGWSPTEIVLQLAIDHLLRLRRTATGWVGADEHLPWTTDTIVVAGSIASNLYEAMDASATALLPSSARKQLTWALADIFEYRVDMSRDLQPGDRFRVMAERSTASTGAVRIGRVLVATLTLSGSETQAIRYRSQSVGGDYFDQEGKSLRTAFLRAPLEFRRISSGFGMRKHPILGTRRLHKGTDYAAAIGTPVRAVGDGVVVRAGWGMGYGNLLEIRHRNGFVTRYGHLRAFAHGIHAGTRVTIGETVAFVGTTGLSTGPHLHFEVLINGVQHDPRIALRAKSGDPIPTREWAEFQGLHDRMIASLNGPPGTGRLASR